MMPKEVEICICKREYGLGFCIDTKCCKGFKDISTEIGQRVNITQSELLDLLKIPYFELQQTLEQKYKG